MIYVIVKLLEACALAGTVAGIGYYILCLVAAGSFLVHRRRLSAAAAEPVSPFPVSILKPLKGVDPEIYESFRSHCLQDYPEYEIIFGVSDPADAALTSVERLKQEFRDRSIQLVVCPHILGPNVKVSNLEQMVAVSRYESLIVNDSD